jgi:hypothetical protein
MSFNLRISLTSFAFCALLGSTAANGDTVLKLSLGNTGSEVAMVQNGANFFVGTTSDGIAGTTGDQNTAIDYTGFLDPVFADVTTNTASFSLAGLKRTGNPSIIGSSVIVQDFFGGTFNLYSPTNSLLLSGDLQDSTLTGVIGNNGTGSIFSTKVGTFTSGSLLPYLKADSLNVSIPLTNVNNGLGFVVSGSPFALQPFTADASVNISADPGPLFAPEPGSIAMALLGAVGLSFIGRRRA